MMSILANRIVFVFALLGMQVAGYLTLAHLNILNLICGGVHGCDKVAHHATAHGFGIPWLAPIPTATFGLAFYILMLALSQLRAGANSRQMCWGLGVVQWGMSLAGMLLSVWLTFLEAYVIHGWCLWCLVSAGIILIIFTTLTLEMLLATHPSRQEYQTVRTFKPRESSRFMVIFLVVLFFDGSATMALRKALPVKPATQKTAPVQKSLLLQPEAHRYGNPTAPYTLMEFGDYACTHCQDTAPQVELLLTQHPKMLNFIFHYYPMVSNVKIPALDARTAQAASIQGKFWAMHMRLFTREKANAAGVNLAWVQATAMGIGLNPEQFQRDLNSPATLHTLAFEAQLGDKLRISGVPAFFIIDPKGKTIPFPSFAALQQWVEAKDHAH